MMGHHHQDSPSCGDGSAYLCLWCCYGLRETKERQGKVDKAILIRLEFLVALNELKVGIKVDLEFNEMKYCEKLQAIYSNRCLGFKRQKQLK